VIHKAELLALLATYPNLRELPSTQLQAIVAEGRRLRVAAGEVLFDEGGSCGHFVMVLSGTVRVFKVGDRGKEIGLYRLRPGDCCPLTTLGLLGNVQCPARVVAVEDLAAIAVPRAVFVTMIEQGPSLRAFVFRCLAERLTDLLSRMEEIAFQRIDQRLASLLLARGDSISTTHQELADEVGSTREGVSRLLEAFARRGILRLGRKHIEIVDRPTLAKIATNGRTPA
jgi:CRP/FNR family transcriptional regulator